METSPENLGYNNAALHEIDPVFKDFSNSEKVCSLFRSLGYKRPIIIQSMYIFKVLYFLLLMVWCVLYIFDIM